MTASTAVLAHQGGWDEILLVAAPLAVFAAVLWLANRRANTKLADSPNDMDHDGATDGDTDGLAGEPDGQS